MPSENKNALGLSLPQTGGPPNSHPDLSLHFRVGQTEGLPDSSRGLSPRYPRKTAQNELTTLKGWQSHLFLFHVGIRSNANSRWLSGTPPECKMPRASSPEVSTPLRPLATICQTFGLKTSLAAAISILSLCVANVLQAAEPARDYPVKPVPFTAVHLNDSFWAPRIETNRTVSIPFAFEQCEKSGRMDNFERAAKALRGEELANRKPPGTPFDDTDPYKVLEGASYALAVQPDPKLTAYLDDLIAKIAQAQEPDGYLYTARTMVGKRALVERPGFKSRTLQRWPPI
jgi:hypothetical protein